MAMKSAARNVLLLWVPLTLAGCISDTASYMIEGDRNHAIIVTRSQNWFWEDTVSLTVLATRQPDCMGGLEIHNVPSRDPIILHQAPDEYPEQIYIMDAGGKHYAISNQSCRVQKFETTPADMGPTIGSFRTVDGKFQYIEGNP
jgi:hypothetical protein